jgi:hypothetical protein
LFRPSYFGGVALGGGEAGGLVDPFTGFPIVSGPVEGA